MKRIYLAALVAIVMLAVQTSAGAVEAEGAEKQKAVLVTGASTGIGRKIAELLAANGHFVYAGARKQQDLDALNQIENVQAIRLDVTILEDIDAAVATIREAGRGLHGLVNNAGVGIGGPLIEIDEEELKWMFDVNVFGVYRVTQAFAPLIIESKGRITTIGSISGIVSGPLMGQYSMSKFAIEAYTDALAAEMERFGVRVSVIDPGGYRSQIRVSAMKRMQERPYLKEESLYAEELKRFTERGPTPDQKEPDEVAEAALHTLFDPNPKLRYMVVPNLQQATATINRSIEKVVELNQGQPYAFTREELIEMLDRALGAGVE